MVSYVLHCRVDVPWIQNKLTAHCLIHTLMVIHLSVPIKATIHGATFGATCCLQHVAPKVAPCMVAFTQQCFFNEISDCRDGYRVKIVTMSVGLPCAIGLSLHPKVHVNPLYSVVHSQPHTNV